MKNIKIILLFIFLAGILPTCKKHPDGPTISLRTKKSRVMGHWDINKYLVNGADSTQSLLSRVSCATPIYFYQMDKGDKECSISCPPTTYRYSNWFFEDDKKILAFSNSDTSSVSYPPLHLSGRAKEHWEIQRLTNKEMWLKTTTDNIEYYIELKK